MRIDGKPAIVVGAAAAVAVDDLLDENVAVVGSPAGTEDSGAAAG